MKIEDIKRDVAKYIERMCREYREHGIEPDDTDADDLYKTCLYGYRILEDIVEKGYDLSSEGIEKYLSDGTHNDLSMSYGVRELLDILDGKRIVKVSLSSMKKH